MKRYIHIAIEATVLDARQQCPGQGVTLTVKGTNNVNKHRSPKFVLRSDEPRIHCEGLLAFLKKYIRVTADSSIFDKF